MEAELRLKPKLGKLEVKRDASDAQRRSVYSTGEDKVLYALVTAEEDGYDRVTVCRGRDGQDTLGSLAAGCEWLFVVRAVLADGTDDGNRDVLQVEPKATAPAAFDAPLFVQVGDEDPELTAPES